MISRRPRAAQELGELGMQLVFVRAGRAAVENHLDRSAHAQIAVAQKRGPVTAAQVDVFPAIEVPEPATLGAIEVKRVAKGSIETSGRRDAAGQILTGLVKLIQGRGP
jgi:hypothetical protein